MSNVIRLPTTRGDKWRKEMADSLRYYADLIDNDGAEPQIESFVIALKQDDQFAIGGCGKLTVSERRKLRAEFNKFIRNLGS